VIGTGGVVRLVEEGMGIGPLAIDGRRGGQDDAPHRAGVARGGQCGDHALQVHVQDEARLRGFPLRAGGDGGEGEGSADAAGAEQGAECGFVLHIALDHLDPAGELGEDCRGGVGQRGFAAKDHHMLAA
jgi:hypothetical protein